MPQTLRRKAEDPLQEGANVLNKGSPAFLRLPAASRSGRDVTPPDIRPRFGRPPFHFREKRKGYLTKRELRVYLRSSDLKRKKGKSKRRQCACAKFHVRILQTN